MTRTGPPLDKVKIAMPEGGNLSEYPFCLPIINTLEEITFPTQVTFFVGENGTGKSTLLEAIAISAGFGREGGSRNISFQSTEQRFADDIDALARCVRLSWRKKPRDGYFFRAESFFNLANHVDTIAREGGQGAATTYAPYGGKSLHEQSHGESFLSFFNNRMGGGGFYVLDEPEAALSPQRQLALLRVMFDLCKHPDSQLVIATHSPILLAYPGATIYSCDGKRLERVAYEDTAQFDITKHFLENPSRYLAHLLRD